MEEDNLKRSAEDKNPDPPSRYKGPPRKKTKVDPVVLEVRRAIHRTCKTNDLATAMETFDRAIEGGIHLESNTLYCLLSLCDGLGDRIHIGTPKPKEKPPPKESQPLAEAEAPAATTTIRPVTMEERQQFASRVQKRMDELGLPLNETACTALVRLYSRANEVEKAEAILAKAEQLQQCRPKMRLYAPLLSIYCQSGQMKQALRLWERVSQQNLLWTEKEYALLMHCATLAGDHETMERAFSNLAEDVLIPSHSTNSVIQKWFESPYSQMSQEAAERGDEARNTDKTPAVRLDDDDDAMHMGPVCCKQGWAISYGCDIDTATGVLLTGCMKGVAVQPLDLSPSAWTQMMHMNETIVLQGKLDNDTSIFQGGKKGPKRPLDEQALKERARHWGLFKRYLEQHYQDKETSLPRLDVVLDAANIGYYEKNFPGAPKHVDYEQIDWVVRHFRERNQSVLLVLHERHFSPSLLPREFEPIVKSWKDILYKSPAGMNDDWFWLHAALWAKCYAVTNDQGRDHHFQMVKPRFFLRWRERHQIQFQFGGWQDKRRQVLLDCPDLYSRRIQMQNKGFIIPLPKKGDENRFLDGTHVASSEEPDRETYLCISPR